MQPRHVPQTETANSQQGDRGRDGGTVASQATPVAASPALSRSDKGSTVSASASNAWSANWRAAEHGRSHPGFLQVYGPENIDDAHKQLSSRQKEPDSVDGLQPDLRQSFAETYFEYCYAWCPVLERDTIFQELASSSLLDNALGLVGSHIRPPMILHVEPVEYYDRARRRFYDDEENELELSLKAVLLFYWWAPRPPSMVHRHSSWWWTSVVIRHAQQAGFHQASDVERTEVDIPLRRRIWWTAYARERLTALCQGKPCIINPEDCDVMPPSLADFPDPQNELKAQVFIHWVRLCTIAGEAAKELALSSKSRTSRPFPTHLGRQLIEWSRSLPPHLQLPLSTSHTPNFNIDIHQLHLPYLAMIVVLHLNRSPHSLPQANPPATAAATCIARILKDILIRSGMRFLMPITCWYSGMAFIALLHASRSEHLRDNANADLEILHLAVKELKKMWGTANLFDKGFERLLAQRDASHTLAGDGPAGNGTHQPVHSDSRGAEDQAMSAEIDWMEYFPFLTPQTSAVAERVLGEQSLNMGLWDESYDPSAFNINCFEGLDEFADPQMFFPWYEHSL